MYVGSDIVSQFSTLAYVKGVKDNCVIMKTERIEMDER